MHEGEQPLGAYGLRLSGAGAGPYLVPAPSTWAHVEVIRQLGRVPSARTSLDTERAAFALGDEGQLVVDRQSRRCVFTTARPLSDPELVHPYLAPVGAAFAWWAARDAFHAGGIVVGDGAWAVIGDRRAGKSSLLAWLALAGFSVVCDDMLVIDRGRALAGPRCVDLRTPTAKRFGVGELLTIGGPRERWRVQLGPVPAELPFRGWIFLEWGDQVDGVRLGAAERLVRLSANRSMTVPPKNPETLLDLAARPAWRLTRPEDWEALPRVVDRLMELLAG